MFDAATLGFAIDLAHKAGRDRRDLDTTEVARIVEIAVGLAKVDQVAQAHGHRIAVTVEPAETRPENWPSHDVEERMVLLAVRRMGPCQTTAISEGMGWPPRRVRTVIQRLCVKDLVRPYMGSLYKITNAGHEFIIETSDA